jgi:AcrR family transcriptional regulator
VQLESLARQEIQDAVIRILTRPGARGLTMEKVAMEAGMAKGTLYLYYKDKKQLIQSVKDASFNPLVEEILVILGGPLPPAERLTRAIARHVGYFDENRGFFRVLLWDRQLPGARARRDQSDRYRAYVLGVTRVLEEGMRSRAFKRLDAARLAPILIEATIAMIDTRLRRDDPGPVEDDVKLLREMILNGIASRRSGVIGSN